MYLCIRLWALLRSHFLIDFHKNLHRRKNLFINDVTDLFDGTVNVKLYADDVKIYFEIINNASVECLQKGINDLSTWAEKWQLRFP